MNARQVIGKWGENVAAETLRNRGWTVAARNYRTPYGELDVIARKGNTVLFVEVKTRTSDAYGMPEDSISPSKAKHLLESAQYYLQEHGLDDIDWRVDVIAIQGRPNQPNTHIEWFENVLS